MINESRIKLMTKMASYEAGEGKKNMAIGTYFRGDYIGKEVIKSIIYGTITYVILFAMYICYDFEFFLQDIYKMDLLEFGKTVLIDYLKLVVSYAIITYLVYALRYQKARRSLRIYYNNLRRLASMYRKEKKSRNSIDRKNGTQDFEEDFLEDTEIENYQKGFDDDIYDDYLIQKSSGKIKQNKTQNKKSIQKTSSTKTRK